MIRTYLLVIALIASTANGFSAVKVASPDGRLEVSVEVANGSPVYSIYYDNDEVLLRSPLGFRSNIADFTTGMSIIDTTRTSIDKHYVQDRIKHSEINYKANGLSVGLANPDGNSMNIEWQVSDNNVAMRYVIPRQGVTSSIVVTEEETGFRFPEGTSVFLTSQSDPMVGWRRSKPSYEEIYLIDMPLDTKSQFGRGFTFPCLFRTSGNDWILISETDVDGYYCGSHLSDAVDGCYTIAYPMQEENNGNGTASPGMALPGHTPWRTLTIGDNLAPIVETTIPWDVVEPRYELGRKARAGRGTWSWIVWQDASINFGDQKRFIDLAASMGYESALIDNWWDVKIGREKIEELVRYAADKNVNIILWYSSSGYWNDIDQSPTNRMDRPIVRKKEMKWLKDIGVKGIKVDFFGGDKQETIRLYEDILSDAADYGLDVIFHGCTLPRGWERMYPNYVGSEAVLASENIVFDQFHCDIEAQSATMHPFIRNAVGSMEFGGTFLNRRLNRTNDGGTTRMTGDAFQLATAVLFQNAVQNFALTPDNLTDAPAEAIEFMKAVPTTWDETKFIDGYPGKYVMLARRHGDKWYVAGVNADDSNRTFILPEFIGNDAKIYFDKDVHNMSARIAGDSSSVTVPSKCGFVAVGSVMDKMQ